MGDVVVTMKVMPDGIEIDLNKLKEEITSSIKPEKIEEAPVAFGLKALMVQKIIPDGAGGTDEIENKVSEIKGVQSVDVTDVSLI